MRNPAPKHRWPTPKKQTPAKWGSGGLVPPRPASTIPGWSGRNRQTHHEDYWWRRRKPRRP